MCITSPFYTLGAYPVTGKGLSVSASEIDALLTGPVAAVVFDNDGRDEVAALLEGLADTDFAKENLETLLNGARQPEDWRVGEALAETFLTQNKACYFPWPDGRDERKRGSSLPGADLVGFHHDGQTERFAFGEVKTSAENAYPPSAAYGRHGLKQQLEDLRNCRTIRNDLVMYLAHRAVRASWATRFQAAAAVYLRDTHEVRIFGLLVRDVTPNHDDLRARVSTLGLNCPANTVIELLAIYLPQGRIATLGSQVMAAHQRGGAQ
ncbi:MAG: hypothetical protein JW942_06810 [Opitutales bacterium]|nr:hypothetical protein [Opitutales bacterium]